MNGQLPVFQRFPSGRHGKPQQHFGLAVVNPNPDALEEFKVTSSNYDAEFGNVSGAMLQGTTKSGTNQYHGSAFEYLRNNVLNAADPFSHIDPPIRWNQFGGTIGGPIKKDKLFVFFAYEGTRRRVQWIGDHHRSHRRGAQRRSQRASRRLHLRRWHHLRNRLLQSGEGHNYRRPNRGCASRDGLRSQHW